MFRGRVQLSGATIFQTGFVYIDSQNHAAVKMAKFEKGKIREKRRMGNNHFSKANVIYSIWYSCEFQKSSKSNLQNFRKVVYEKICLGDWLTTILFGPDIILTGARFGRNIK